MTNKTISDFGVKIGGAKKDNYIKKGGLTLEDTMVMHTLEKPKFIIKDNIWIKPDYKAMLDEGYDAEATYFIKTLRDALPAKPESYNIDAIDRFIDILDIYKELSTKIKRFCDIPYAQDMLRSIASERGYKYLLSGPNKKAFTQAKMSKLDLLELKYEVEILNFPHEFNGKLKGLTIRQTGYTDFRIVKNGRRVNDFKCDHTSKESAMKTIREEIIPYLLNKEISRKKREYQKYNRPQLKNIKRVGPNYRRGINITGEIILEKLNLRAGEFGNWNTDLDKKAYLNYYYEAICDLMHILKAPLSFAGLGFETEDDRDTRLAIAFGSRGVSSALAHYEPAYIVINLTKMKGAGSLAHEMGHAIDHFIGESCGFKHSLYTESGGAGFFFKERAKLYPEIQESFHNLMDVMLTKKCTNEEIIEIKNKSLETCIPNIKTWLRNIENTTVRTRKEGVKSISDEDKQKIVEAKEKVINEMSLEAIDNLNKVYKSITNRLPSKDIRDSITSIVHRYITTSESIRKIKEEGVIDYQYTKNTDYYSKAKDMDKLSNSHYLQKKPELFARAFECYVDDKLKEMDRRSDYLVHSTANSSYSNYNPYPSGEERILINKAMEEFLSLVVSTFSKRSDDSSFYIDFSYEPTIHFNEDINHSLVDPEIDTKKDEVTKSNTTKHSLEEEPPRQEEQVIEIDKTIAEEVNEQNNEELEKYLEILFESVRF